MLAINIFAYHHANSDGDNETELTGNEQSIRSFVTDLIAGSLNAFLLPVYTFKQEDSLLDYFALPASELCILLCIVLFFPFFVLLNEDYCL